jgi:hypothetical protein
MYYKHFQWDDRELWKGDKSIIVKNIYNIRAPQNRSYAHHLGGFWNVQQRFAFVLTKSFTPLLRALSALLSLATAHPPKYFMLMLIE